MPIISCYFKKDSSLSRARCRRAWTIWKRRSKESYWSDHVATCPSKASLHSNKKLQSSRSPLVQWSVFWTSIRTWQLRIKCTIWRYIYRVSVPIYGRRARCKSSWTNSLIAYPKCRLKGNKPRSNTSRFSPITFMVSKLNSLNRLSTNNQ
jgi:hypothetical protein